MSAFVILPRSEQAADDGPKNMDHHQYKDIAHGRIDGVHAEIRRKELASLTAVGFAHEHQHCWGQRRLEAHVAEHVDDSYAIKEDVKQCLHANAKLPREDHQQDADDIEVEEQLYRP